MPVTIKDVAQLAGVSRSTVSKVINDSPRISDRTKEAVRKVMAKLDYHPNRIAQGFAHQRTYTLGMLMVLERFSAYNNPYIFEILCGVESVCNSRNYNISLVNLRNVEDKMAQFNQIVAEKRVDGFLLHAADRIQPLIKVLQAYGIPFVLIGEPAFRVDACWVDINNEYAGERAAQHLLDRGYQRPAFVGYRNDTISALRFKGFLNVFRESLDGHFSTEPWLVEQPGTEAGYTQWMQYIASNRLPPDSLIINDNLLAAGVLRAVHESGVQVPSELGVISFDNHPLSHVSYPPLSVVDVDLFDLGANATHLLFELFDKPEKLVQTRLLSADVIVRQSTLGLGTATAK